MELEQVMNKMHTLGTVVKLHGESDLVKNFKLVIVDRFLEDDKKKGVYYDYKGTFYPMGAIENNGKGILFNEEHIKQVLYYGYKDEQDDTYVKLAQESLEKQNYTKSTNMKKTN